MFQQKKPDRAKLAEGDKEKYTGKIDLSAERKQGERPDRRWMENEGRQKNGVSGIVKIVEPGNPKTQSLYASDKADEALEEKKKIVCEWVKERTEIYRVKGPPKIKFNLKHCKPDHLREISEKHRHPMIRLK